MRDRTLNLLIIGLLAMSLGALPAGPSSAVGVDAVVVDAPHVLVFSGTFGFRHPSITHGNQVVAQLAMETGAFTVEFTENPLDLVRDKLATADLVLWNSNTGRTPLTAEQRTDLERYWACGGGSIGIHAATDANYGWPEYAELWGAQFTAHPHTGPATLVIENPDHPLNAAYDGVAELTHSDEFYQWHRDVRGRADVTPLMSIDVDSVPTDAYVERQPLVWAKTFRDRGRVYYNNLGHNDATWDTSYFQESLLSGIEWVGGVELDRSCLHGKGEIPAAPTAPPPPVGDDGQPAPKRDCEIAEGRILLTPGGSIEVPVQPLATPVYLGQPKPYYDFVVDLRGTGDWAAEVGLVLAWDNPTADLDINVVTPWGFEGSDSFQPFAEPEERAEIHGVQHCAEFSVGVWNHHAVNAGNPVLTIDLSSPTAVQQAASR